MQRDRRYENERQGYEGRGRRDESEGWRSHERNEGRGEMGRGMGEHEGSRRMDRDRDDWRGGQGMDRDREEWRSRGMDRDREGWRSQGMDRDREGWRSQGMDRDREEGRSRGMGRDDWRERGEDDWRTSMEDRDMWRGRMGGMGQDWRRMGVQRETRPGGGRDWRDTETYYGREHGGSYGREHGGSYGGGYGGGHGGERWQERGEGRRREHRAHEDDDRGIMNRVGEGIRRFFGSEDEGERGPHYGKGPRGYRRSDERVREDVCDRLANYEWVDASDVEVRVHEGEVTLSGTVHTRREKRIMEDLVESVSGVKDVHNQIRIERERRTSGRSEDRVQTRSS